MSPQEDRLIHILLRELLGGQKPPDLADRILRKAFPEHRLNWALAAAAVVVLAVPALILYLGRYPDPRITGSYEIVGGATLGRGATVQTDREPATLTLGGYCRVDIAPASSLRIEGTGKRAEGIYLNRGMVTCRVKTATGSFEVRTDVGKVSTLGATFTVELSHEKGGKDEALASSGRDQSRPLQNQEKGDQKTMTKQMIVRVLVGAVLVSGTWGEYRLNAGETARGPHYERVTITGIGKSLVEDATAPNKHFDPSVPNATVTVETPGEGGKKAQTVYYVAGWAGAIVAIKGDGKKVEVTGVVSEKDGKKTITGRSVDVKILVVEEKPAKK